MHGRILDFDFADYMRSITYRAKFVRDGQYVYDAVMFAGIVGVYTGMKGGAFAITENQRFNQDDNEDAWIGLLLNFLYIFIGYNEISWVIRSTLEKCGTFDCAHEILRDSTICALGYIILSGTKENEGVVITRDLDNTVHEEWLDSENGKWYIVQTNSDHFEDICKYRCEEAKKNMDNLSQEKLDMDLFLLIL